MKRDAQAYVLEANNEFERLENQSLGRNYNFKEELADLIIKPKARILDAGCGSGIVTRFLAQIRPHAQVVGCDVSEARITQAASAAAKFQNVTFQTNSLDAIKQNDNSFDLIVCRYVYQHIDKIKDKVSREFFRVLKPGGTICLIDADGFIVNLEPQTPFVRTVLEKAKTLGQVNFNAGRSLGATLIKGGFEQVQTDETEVYCVGEDLKLEASLMAERFKNAKSFFELAAGSEEGVARLSREYLTALNSPGATYRYKKFIVTARKPKAHLTLIK